jgi:hypothetical protein
LIIEYELNKMKRLKIIDTIKLPYRELLAHKEFQALVKNTYWFL